MLQKNRLWLALAVLPFFGACKDENEIQNVQNAAPKVQVEIVEPQDIPLSFEFSARAQGSKETEVRARVGGILLKRNYVEGSAVEEGDVLFQIDPAPFEVALSQAEAKLAQSEAQLRAAETQWDRISKLFEQRIVSEKSRDEARANLDSLRASTALAKAEVDSAQLNLDYTTVTAPISGITSMETQSEGSLISSTGDASLLTHITQQNPIYVIFSASENEILSLSNMVERGLIRNPQNKTEIRAKVKAGDKLYPQEGEINFINPNVDQATGTIKLRAVFPNDDGKIRPGQFLRLIMEGLTRIDALVVPQEAVMQGANGAYVYRVNSQNMVETVSVQAGLTTAEGGWIIDEGLNPGDKVIINGLLKVRPGMKVDPVVVGNQAAAPEPAGEIPANA